MVTEERIAYLNALALVLLYKDAKLGEDDPEGSINDDLPLMSEHTLKYTTNTSEIMCVGVCVGMCILDFSELGEIMKFIKENDTGTEEELIQKIIKYNADEATINVEGGIIDTLPAIPPEDYKGSQADWMIALQSRGLWDGQGWYGDIMIPSDIWWEILEEVEGSES